MSIYDPQDQDDLPEASRMVGGIEYMSVAEYLRRLIPDEYPIVDELVTPSGADLTYQRLGQVAAAKGRNRGIAPIKLYHPDYGSINGWPSRIIQPAWIDFHGRYHDTMRWAPRDEVQIPEPDPTPPPPYSTKLLEQLRTSLQIRGIDLPYTKDPRWQGAHTMLTASPRSESPEQALVRRTSAIAAMYAIEKEYTS